MIVALVSAVSHAQENQPEQQPQTPPADRTQQQPAPPAPVTIAVEREKTIEPDWGKPNCEKPQTHDEADLRQQRQMAKAAEDAVFLNQIQVGIGVVGGFLLFWTIVYSRRAAVAAGEAAIAAQAAVHSDRAWMTFARCDFSSISGQIDDRAVKKGLGIKALWQNTGRTPAIGVQAFLAHKVTGIDDPIPTFDPGSPDDSKSLVIGLGVTVGTVWHALDDDEYVALRERRARVYVYSRVVYFDLFKTTERRVSEVCAEIDSNGERVGPEGPIPNIDVGPVGPQNTAS